ncbi:beta-propeller domain-containing protein [Candidatus Bathyarchaeota archaeon]|nr:beta-propeller domain-containing protein [Candidatus Bathyarchaeota archaeon]
MVQKEVRKKTRIYGTVAVLSAIVLVTMIYAFGSAPMILPPSQTASVSGMKTFSSLEELKNYLSVNSQGGSSYRGGPLDSRFFGSAVPTAVPAMSAPQGFGLGATETSSSDTYSTTNIQVAGVDEADTVKTDGQYIYALASTQNIGYYFGYYPQTNNENAVYVIAADPQDARVVSKITLDNNTQPAGLFLSQDGSKLVVLASRYQMYSYGAERSGVAMLAPYRSDVYTFINVYDVSNKVNPVLTRNFTVSGSYFNSRMIGNYVYAVVSQPAMVYNNAVTLPAVYQDKKEYDVTPSTVYYADMEEPSYYTFTSFFGVNVLDDTQQPTNMTVMMGGASTMYVSTDNIYITYPTWTQENHYTSIYRVSINGLQLTFEAQGSVPGNVLNQYSMDEYNGNFRVAVNWQGQTEMGISKQGGTKMNNVYVLNSNLTIIGKLEGLAQNENLHSVRFMGDKCYLVTFMKTDPLFVIDLSQPENPKVLGELKIPGYSDYLHPYDETHLIGLGKETVDAETGSFAWYQGLKLSLFDVSNVNNPIQLAKYVIGDRGTDSIALSEPKAFLFDKAKNLLVIPVNLAIIDKATDKPQAQSYGEMVWQGAYVFSVSLNGGITLKGTLTHLNASILNNQGYIANGAYWSSQNDWITRSLYIDNTLYTISNSKVQLNNLETLNLVTSVNLR